MRPFEVIVIVCVGALLLLLPTLRRSPRAGRGAALGVAVFVGAQLVIEAPRWQMVPAYVVALAVAAVALRGRREEGRPPSRLPYVLGAVSGLGLLATSVVLSTTFPVFTLPEPTGPHSVGRTSLLLADSSRTERHSPRPDDVRRLVVEVWYPAAPDVAQRDREPYWRKPGERSRELGYLLGANADVSLPGFLFSHLDLVRTHGRAEAPVARAAGPFPVLLFSHGIFAGYAGQNTPLMEELASHGYVVLSIEHTYWGLPSALLAPSAPVGRDILAEYRAMTQEFELPEVERLRLRLSEEDVGEGLGPLMERHVALTPRQSDFYRDGIAEWSADQRFVLDAVERLQREEGRFSGRLDLQRVAVAGMSFGGFSSVYTCAVDERCRAGISLDGFNVVLSELDAVPVPFLYMQSEENFVGFMNLQRFAEWKHRAVAYVLRIAGTQHFDYSDLNLVAPAFEYVGQLGSIDSGRMVRMMNDYVLGFLELHLRGVEGGGVLSEIDEYAAQTEFAAVGAGQADTLSAATRSSPRDSAAAGAGISHPAVSRVVD